MVKKLLKYEWLYYAKTLLLFEGILLVIAVVNRLLTNLDPTDETIALLQVSLTLITIFGFAACFIVAFVMILSRFYKNLFTSEGYLMFTLPVTETQHILSKLIAAVLALLSALITTLLYFIVVFSHENFLHEIYTELLYLFDVAYIEIGFHLYLYAIEALLLMIVGCVTSVLFFYMCIALGQIIRIKNRVLSAVLVYFGLNMLYSIVSPIITQFFANAFGVKIQNLMTMHPIATTHGILIVFILFYALFMALFFFVIRYIMKYKLNLE